jgi:hypothetical protein
MSRQKFKHVIQWAIALFIAVVFCTALFVPPAGATCPDPNRRLPSIDPGVSPNGDDGGWNDLDSNENDDTIVIFGYFKVYGFKYIMIHLVPKTIEKNNTLIDNDSSNLKDTDRDRGTSPE